MFRIVLVGFLPTDHGHSCALHPFGCGNAMVLERPTHGVGLQIRMKMVEGIHLAGYMVNDDGSDGCRVCFAAREYAVGVAGQRLDGASVWIKEMLPDNENASKRALFHRNRGYAITELSGLGSHGSIQRTVRNNSEYE